jgi:hypothetical protein
MRQGRTRAALVMFTLVTVLFCLTLGTSAAFADQGGDNVSTATTATLPIVALTGSLDSTTTDCRDVFKIHLNRGQTLSASIIASAGTDFDLMLYRSTVPSIDETKTPRMMWSGGPTSTERFTFMAADSGDYLLDVHAWSGAGSYVLNAKIVPAVNFNIGYLSVPKSAKKGYRVYVSARVTPAYNGVYSPVYFYFYRYENGKYRRKAIFVGDGRRNPGGAYSKLTASYKFPKRGKWRVRAEFWDEAHWDKLHGNKFTSYKYITIK